jgi:diaminopimelate epimerase
VESKPYLGQEVSIGNPHLVIPVGDFNFSVDGAGSSLGTHRDFPNGINVEFVRIIDSSNLAIRIWERGVGETQSCGSGAAAAAIGIGHAHRLTFPIYVHMAGGTLAVSLADGHIHIRGSIRRLS